MYFLGREFEAVFLSTSETVRGSIPSDYTRSPSSHFVFNTILTRAKYFVVVVGNPFLLLKIESEMMKNFPDSCKPCWTPFLRACIDMESIKCSTSLSGHDIQIQNMVRQHFHSEVLDICQSYVASSNDDIVDGYSQVYVEEESGSSYLGTRRTTQDFNNDSSTSKDLENSELQGVRCKLEATSKNEFNARPLHENGEVIYIRGYDNRIGAFDRDTVIVKIFDEDEDPCYGKVLRVLKREVNPAFLCTMSPHNSDLFYPIDNINPGFLNFSQGGRGELEFKQENVKIYHSSSINCGNLVNIHCKDKPIIKKTMPYSDALFYVFRVQYVQWDAEHPFPVGVVTNFYDKGYDLDKAESLLSILHFDGCIDNNISSNSEKLDCAKVMQCGSTTSLPGDNLEDSSANEILSQEEADGITNVFTIDPVNARTLDDALSLSKIQECDDGKHMMCEVGIHVVDAAKHIPHDSPEDIHARRRGIDVYKGQGELKSAMLSKTVRRSLSLDPSKIRDVWSLTSRIKVDKNTLEISLAEAATIKQATVRSVLKLSYEDAQEILNGREIDGIQQFNELNSIPLSKVLKILYNFSLHRAGIRLECDEKYYVEDRDGQNYSCWQTHKLVEEFMIWFTSEVAARLTRRYHSGVVVRRQPPPELEDRELLEETCRQRSWRSLGYSNFVSLNELLIPSTTIELLEKASKEKDIIQFCGLVMTSVLYPQLSVAKSKWKSIQKPAETCTTEIGIPPEHYHHYSLNVDWYSFFTSPLRKYLDIVVQRQLTALVREDDHSVREDDHSVTGYDIEYCQRKIKSSHTFEKTLSEVKLALSMAQKNELHMACIEERSEKVITFHFLHSHLSSFSKSFRKIKITHFKPFRSDITKKSSSVKTSTTTLSWEILITSLKDYIDLNVGGLILERINDCNTTNDAGIELYEQVKDRLKKHHYNVSIKPLGAYIDECDWHKALNLMHNPSKEKSEVMDFIVSNLQNSEFTKDVLQNENFDGIQFPYFKYVLELPFKEADMLKVWIGMVKQKYLLEPAIQLAELSPLFRICLKHHAFPAQCFSNIHLKPASKPAYHNTGEYIDLWKNVLLAEIAVSNVSESRFVIIRDVHLIWPKLTKSTPINGVPKFIVNDHIKINLSPEFGSNGYEFCTIRRGDLICARYGYAEDSSTKFVFHFIVNKVVLLEKIPNEVYLMICPMENEISQEVIDNVINEEKSCEIQVINVNVGHR